MAHYKRKKPKSGRAGCLMCKSHKRQGAPIVSRQRHNINRQLAVQKEKLLDNELDRTT